MLSMRVEHGVRCVHHTSTSCCCPAAAWWLGIPFVIVAMLLVLSAPIVAYWVGLSVVPDPIGVLLKRVPALSALA